MVTLMKSSVYILKKSAEKSEYSVSTGGLGGSVAEAQELVSAGYWVKVREENQWTAPFAVYAITDAGREYLAALGISDEPQAAVAVETPAAQDSEYQPEVGDVVLMPYFDEVVTGLVVSTPDENDNLYTVEYTGYSKEYRFNANEITLVSRPTSAPVAINDDSAVDNTPSEPKREIEQPSAAEPVLSVAAYDALLYIYNVERGLISVHACDSLTRAGLITPICMQGSQWLVKANDAGREYVEKYLLAKESQPVSGWVADALRDTPATWTDALLTPDVVRELATVNVEREAVANDDYLPPTGDEDNDDLPFSDLGEDETVIEITPNGERELSFKPLDYDELKTRYYLTKGALLNANSQVDELEARVRKLESIIQSANSLAYQLRSSLYPIVDSNSLAILCDIEDLTRKEAIN